MTKIPRIITLACLLLWQTLAPGEEAQVASAQKLRIVILKGPPAINGISQRSVWEAIVQVEDQNKRPVPAAKVLFILPERGPSGTFANGSKSITVATDARGQVTAKGLKPNKTPGKFRILVHASFQGPTASAAITQTNLEYFKVEARDGEFTKEKKAPKQDSESRTRDLSNMFYTDTLPPKPEPQPAPPPSSKKKVIAQHPLKETPPPAAVDISSSERRVGLKYRILYRTADCDIQLGDASQVLHSGDKVRLLLESNVDGYLYVLQKGGSGLANVIFPSPQINGGANRIERGIMYSIPPATREWFVIKTPEGDEQLTVIVSRTPMQTLPQQAKNQKEGSVSVVSVLEELNRSVRSRDLELFHEKAPLASISAQPIAVTTTQATIVVNTSKDQNNLVYTEIRLTGAITMHETQFPPRVTVRSFLVDANEAEPLSLGPFAVSKGEGKGFGLYSYVLFASRPTSVTRARYREVVATWLDMFEDLKEYTWSFQLESLNVTYLPLLPRRRLTEPKPSPDWVLENYDYPRARKLLNKLGDTYSKGPYIISTLQPLSDLQGRAELYLQQDLSAVPLRLVPLFLKEFELQVAVERTWAEQALNDLMMNIRSAIEIIAEEEKIAIPALSAVIRLIAKYP